MREICTSGSVRGGGDNVPTYSAALLANRCEVAKESAPVGKRCEAAEEGEPARVVQGQQPAQEHAPEQFAKHAHRQQERGARGDPALAIERNAAARDDHVHMRVVTPTPTIP